MFKFVVSPSPFIIVFHKPNVFVILSATSSFTLDFLCLDD